MPSSNGSAPAGTRFLAENSGHRRRIADCFQDPLVSVTSMTAARRRVKVPSPVAAGGDRHNGRTAVKQTQTRLARDFRFWGLYGHQVRGSRLPFVTRLGH